jgi:hypothetical protein
VRDDYMEAAALKRQQERGGATTYQAMDEDAGEEGGSRRAPGGRDREAEKERNRARQRRDMFEHRWNDPITGDMYLTLYGDSGLAPWVRADDRQKQRAQLNGANVTEENWMLHMARSTQAMNDELAAARRQRLVPYPRYVDRDSDEEDAAPSRNEESKGTDSAMAPPPGEGIGSPRPAPEESARSRQKLKKRRILTPMGLYEPATNVVHFPTHLQPTSAVVERVSIDAIAAQEGGAEADVAGHSTDRRASPPARRRRLPRRHAAAHPRRHARRRARLGPQLVVDAARAAAAAARRRRRARRAGGG